jgi:hypothetical protein
MTKHKTEDYKISAVKYYLNNDKGDGYVNGATNIYKIAYNAINNKERPNYLSRSNNLSGFLEEFPKSKFTRLEIGKP